MTDRPGRKARAPRGRGGGRRARLSSDGSAMSETNLRLDRSAFTVVRGHGNADLRAWWHSRTAAERLEHVEQLRWINYGDPAAYRVHRVLEAAQRERR